MIKFVIFDLWKTLIYKEDSRIKVYPHTENMLESIQMQNYDIGILTNSSSQTVEIVKKKTKIWNYVNYDVFSFETGIGKPDLKMFKKILKKANCKPQEAIMVGDSKYNDIDPAQKLGMNSILYKNYNQLKKDLTNFSIFL